MNARKKIRGAAPQDPPPEPMVTQPEERPDPPDSAPQPVYPAPAISSQEIPPDMESPQQTTEAPADKKENPSAGPPAPETVLIVATPASGAAPLPEAHAEALQRDTVTLLKYALGNGRQVPEKVASLVEGGSLAGLVEAYGQLAQLIRPAVPESVLYLERRRIKNSKGGGRSVPAVRSFMGVGFFSFVLLIACSCSPLVNEKNLSNGLLNNSGLPLLFNMLFISSISCLGATFSILPKITSQIRAATYLPESSTYYWAMLMLGIFGGMILGELLSISCDIPDTPVKFDAVVFSLMGGFASESVFLILKTLMTKVQQLIAGDSKDPSA